MAAKGHLGKTRLQIAAQKRTVLRLNHPVCRSILNLDAEVMQVGERAISGKVVTYPFYVRLNDTGRYVTLYFYAELSKTPSAVGTFFANETNPSDSMPTITGEASLSSRQ